MTVSKDQINNNELETQINFIKSEIDAIQTAMLEKHKPWYKNISTIISVIALIFSFGTTYVSYTRTKAQDIQALRAELRTMLQRTALLPKENIELKKKYENDDIIWPYLSSYINQENSMLARQTAEIAKKLTNDNLSSEEYCAIALALKNSYGFVEAKYFFEQALNKSNSLNSEITALHAYADLYFIIGQPDAGRSEYQKALNIFSKYEGYNNYIQKNTDIFTRLAWAISEAGVWHFDEANKHIAIAENLLSSLSPNPNTEILKTQIDQVKDKIRSKYPN